MSLLQLPTELIEQIIINAIPEGFEALLLTCKFINSLGRPFIKRHKELREFVEHFSLTRTRELKYQPRIDIGSSHDTIARIAAEPVLARYIKHADLRGDGRYIRARWVVKESEFEPELFASSVYLRKACLEWKAYYAKMNEETDEQFYSQYAATFLLTLLPNVETIRLPPAWTPNDSANNVLDAVVSAARQAKQSGNMAALSKTSTIIWRPQRSRNWRNPSVPGPFDICSAIRFLGLPNLTYFEGTSFVVMQRSDFNIPPKLPSYGFGESLEHLDLGCSCIDAITLRSLLRHTARLKSLEYHHDNKFRTMESTNEWNIDKFLASIEATVGPHLESLDIGIVGAGVVITPGKPGLRGLQRLRAFKCLTKLTLSPDLIKCSRESEPCYGSKRNDVGAPTSPSDQNDIRCELWVGDITPLSLESLYLRPDGTDHDAILLEVFFKDLSTRRKELPKLVNINVCSGSVGQRTPGYVERYKIYAHEMRSVW